MLFFGIEYVFGCSIHILFDMELVFWRWNWYVVIGVELVGFDWCGIGIDPSLLRSGSQRVAHSAHKAWLIVHTDSGSEWTWRVAHSAHRE